MSIDKSYMYKYICIWLYDYGKIHLKGMYQIIIGCERMRNGERMGKRI